jgi:microcompartment protein CcmK/EutM
VVSTIHHPIVDGRKLLLAERLDQNGKPTGGYLIAMDAIGAGMGETVIILDEGSGARQILEDDQAPIRSLVVGIVDSLELGSD